MKFLQKLEIGAGFVTQLILLTYTCLLLVGSGNGIKGEIQGGIVLLAIPWFFSLLVAFGAYFHKWAYENWAALDFSQPEKPTGNAFIESFNGSFRDECLNVNRFLCLEDAKEKITAFREEYNHFRPRSARLGI
jgi:putative transposase